MSFPIKYLSLQKPELEYEVAVRGETPGSTVAELRKQITKLVQLFPAEDIASSHLEPADDLQSVSELLNKVNSTLESGACDKGTLTRTENILHHIYHRLNRIDPSDAKEKHVACSSLYRDCYESYLKILDKSIDPLKVEPSNSATAISSNQAPINVAVTCDKSITAELGKLKFDGKSCVRSFIQRVSEFSEARSIPDTKLISFATEIFTDDALHWFRSIRDQVSSWDDLVILLKQDFDKPDYDYRLLSEIRARTQGKTENITIYLSILSGMFSRLSKPLSREDMLEIVLHNIRPCYASTLASATDIRDIDQVRILCRNYETVQSRLAHFREPLASTSDTLAPEFAYKHPKSESTCDYKTNTNIKQNINTNDKYLHSIVKSTSQIDKRMPYCPRCRNNSHNLRQCTNTEIMCFKCGHKGVKKPDCPNCSNTQNTKN